MSDTGVWKTMEDIEQSMIRVSSFSPSGSQTAKSPSPRPAAQLATFAVTGVCLTQTNGGGGRGRLRTHMFNNSLVEYREQCVRDDLRNAPHLQHEFSKEDLRHVLRTAGQFDDGGGKEFEPTFGRTKKKKSVRTRTPPIAVQLAPMPESSSSPVVLPAAANSTPEPSHLESFDFFGWPNDGAFYTFDESMFVKGEIVPVQPSDVPTTAVSTTARSASCGVFSSLKPRRCRNALLLSLLKREAEAVSSVVVEDDFDGESPILPEVDLVWLFTSPNIERSPTDVDTPLPLNTS